MKALEKCLEEFSKPEITINNIETLNKLNESEHEKKPKKSKKKKKHKQPNPTENLTKETGVGNIENYAGNSINAKKSPKIETIKQSPEAKNSEIKESNVNGKLKKRKHKPDQVNLVNGEKKSKKIKNEEIESNKQSPEVEKNKSDFNGEESREMNEEPKKKKRKLDITTENDLNFLLENVAESLAKKSDENEEEKQKNPELDNIESETNEKKEVKKRKSKEKIVTEVHPNSILINNDILDIDEEIVEEDIEYQDIKELNIIVPWEIPELHTLEPHLRPGSLRILKEEIQSRDLKVNYGPYSKEEDQTILENWRLFCKLHGFDDVKDSHRFIKAQVKKDGATVSIFRRGERVKFGRFIAHGLENRILWNTLKRWSILVTKGNFKEGRYNAEEDAIIEAYIKDNPDQINHIKLASYLNRSVESLQKHMNYLRNEKGAAIYVEKEKDRIINALLKATGCEDLEDLKFHKITDREWALVRKETNIGPSKMRGAWISLQPKIFADKTFSQIKKELIVILHKRGETDMRTVKWKKIARYFTGCSSTMLAQLTRDVFKHWVPAYMRDNMKDSLEYLMKTNYHQRRQTVFE